MASSADLLADAFGRIRENVHGAMDGLSDDALAWRADPNANSIAWLVWHLTRIIDDHLADAFAGEQVWTSGGWCDRFGLPFPPTAHGYGHTSEDVAAVRASADLLGGYHDAVQDQAARYIAAVGDADLDRLVDERWDPPVTLAVRLVSVIADSLQHAGQAAFVRGLVERR